ncbi:MAG: hypothetical protein P8L77_01225, partial [Gammaproteobacteria bacterium]|nr:hypothetical protein [Gammaproteobacteria bacterium]
LFVTGSSIIYFEYKNKNISVKKAVADFMQLHTKVFNERNKIELLCYLSKKINRNGDCDALIKEASAALNIDITIENMYKLLPLEDFNFFNSIYNIYLRDLFINHEVYPGNEENITDYASDYLYGFPRCMHTNKIAFHKLSLELSFDWEIVGGFVSRKARKERLELNNHPLQKYKMAKSDIKVLGDQKLKCCSQALIYGFKMHTLDVLYAKDPKSPLIKILLTTFNEEEKTKSAYKQWVRMFEGSSPISVSMFGNESKEAALTDDICCLY